MPAPRGAGGFGGRWVKSPSEVFAERMRHSFDNYNNAGKWLHWNTDTPLEQEQAVKDLMDRFYLSEESAISLIKALAEKGYYKDGGKIIK